MTVVDALFILRFFPLALAGFLSTRSKDYPGMLICLFYMAVTSVYYIYANPALNAVFSTPLVFLTAWYIIKCNRRVR